MTDLDKEMNYWQDFPDSYDDKYENYIQATSHDGQMITMGPYSRIDDTDMLYASAMVSVGKHALLVGDPLGQMLQLPARAGKWTAYVDYEHNTGGACVLSHVHESVTSKHFLAVAGQVTIRSGYVLASFTRRPDITAGLHKSIKSIVRPNRWAWLPHGVVAECQPGNHALHVKYSRNRNVMYFELPLIRQIDGLPDWLCYDPDIAQAIGERTASAAWQCAKMIDVGAETRNRSTPI